jgi:hypothetical protein
MVYYDRGYFQLIWSMYGFRSLLLLFWMGSSHQFCTILKVLHFHEFPEKIWKIQNKNCAMASVGVSRIRPTLQIYLVLTRTVLSRAPLLP